MDLHLERILEFTGEQDNLSPAPCSSVSNQEAARQGQLLLLRTRKEKTTRREAESRILKAQEPEWGSAAAAHGQSISREPETNSAAKPTHSPATFNSCRTWEDTGIYRYKWIPESSKLLTTVATLTSRQRLLRLNKEGMNRHHNNPNVCNSRWMWMNCFGCLNSPLYKRL